MIELAGPLAIVALTLAAAGAFKLRDPDPTVSMFRALGLLPKQGGRDRSGRALARAVGAAEVAIGLAAFLVGGFTAYVLAAGFALFAVLMARLVLLGDAASSCGCFGSLSSRPTVVHVAVDALAAGVALAAAIAGAPGVIGAVGELGGLGVPFIALTLLGAWALVAVMTVLPDALSAARRDQPVAAPAFRLVESRPPRRRRTNGPA